MVCNQTVSACTTKLEGVFMSIFNFNKINKQITKLMKSNRKKQNMRNKIYTNLLSLGYSNEMILRNINNYDFSN